ncbi:hypothetical protein CYMTET_14094 [Cymbomonas tetramitiformis]|uniref:Ion transport domain-containing protein n=1 Tax=Cymbomonas tetramitiformis TaxID=36881 RepID=A0AAE0GGR9_9CHLO|nr:hypothetical protein CYMTET_14094 [Cymbomonas tetramitiformis]
MPFSVSQLLTYSPVTYWRSYQNRFDAVVTIALFFAAVLVAVLDDVSSELLRYFAVLRQLRLLRLLAYVPAFKRLVASLRAVVLACVPLVMVVLLTIYVFAATGVLLFGGLMFPQNADLAEVSGFESGGAYVNSNFNDMPSAMVTLFDILVAGFDPNVVEGVAAVASTFQARLFFLIFYLVGSVVLFNVFTAFIIDAFIANYESEDIQAAGSDRASAVPPP